MLTNMESAKVLSTPFSINDILTRNNNAHHQQLQQRRYSGADSETELSMVNAEMLRRRRKSCEEDLNKSTSTSNSDSYQRSRDINIYKLSQCNLSSPDSAASERKLEHSSHAGDYMQFFASAALDNNNHADYVVSRKLGYYGATSAGNRDCPIDMRRCTSNDSGELI